MVLPVVVAILGTLVGVSLLNHAPAVPFIKKDKVVVIDEQPASKKTKAIVINN
jgi:hypothetical protein